MTVARSLRIGFGGLGTPVILQNEAAECGLACLAMVAAAHGLHVDLPALRQRFNLSLKGATMADLATMAHALKLQTRAVRAEPEQLGQLPLPAILHWDFNHFVVLVKIGRDAVLIHDPARGAHWVKWARLSRHFTGAAMELTPDAGFERRDEQRRITMRQLLGRVVGLKRSLAQIVALALVLEFFVLLSPFYLQWVVDDVLVTADRDLLVTLGIGFALLVTIQVATAAIRSWAVLHLSATLNLQWLGNVFAHLLRLPLAWFERRHMGDIWSRFFAVQQIQKTLTTSFLEVLLDGALVVTTLAMMALYSLLLSAVVLGFVVVYALLRWVLFAPMRRATEEALVHDAKKTSHFLESLRGVMAIKLFAAETDRRARFMNLVVDAMNADMVVRRLEVTLAVANRGLFGLERVLVIWIGASLVLDQTFTVGMLLAFVAYKEQFSQRVGALIDKWAELGMLKVQGERLADIVLSEPEAVHAQAPGLQPVDNAAAAPRIELRGVGFRYSDSEGDVLRNVSLSIEPGESIAIVGPSGCGKTTLIKLMLGILAPVQGEVLVGGRPLEAMGSAAWRAMVGTVMQDEPLFAGAVADNISFFDPRPDMERVVECARLAAVHDEIAALPMGYYTLIGEMGSTLSGGQKQRVLLARALYKRPRVLFLDEATSALDIERERLVNQAVRQLKLTRVIVAHRPETIASADRVVVLAEGNVSHELRAVATAIASQKSH
ncbi:MAG: peptidase domain-containing ABC transporter [Burkholderiaceae bacterium]|nr:MAG: peptidase domain-containing ABC transporter [Burkholderiaceae bacterium]MBE7425046.1 peptidase domain-containing ABC transporter [Ideonella sp.]MCC7288742.1 peptidase domain-containing ABC transporter [Burkholderiaceae bacterium]